METTKVNYNGKIIDFVINISDEEIESNYMDEDLEDTLVLNENEVNAIQNESIGVVNE